MKKIRKIAIIGAGIMGHGIAIVGAKSGCEVTMNDIKEEFVVSAMERIKIFLAKSVEKRKITEKEEKQILSKIKGTTKIEDVKDCDLVVEAITENVNLKKKLFQKLDKLCPKETIFASNTSTILIGKLSLVTKRPDKFIGMHFMNPAPVMKLVEVVKSKKTSEETVQTIKELAIRMEKIPIEVNDSPGFISNRLLIPMINEAAYCLMEGVAKREAIDDVMKIGMNHPMGPLEIADLIGIDTCLYIMEELQREFASPKYKPCPLLKKMIKAGSLGRKTGKGFYDYEKK